MYVGVAFVLLELELLLDDPVQTWDPLTCRFGYTRNHKNHPTTTPIRKDIRIRKILDDKNFILLYFYMYLLK